MKGAILTYVLTYGGALVALFDPFIGLLIYIAFAILRPESLWGWALSGGGNFSRIVGIAVLVGWAVTGFGRWQLGRARGVINSLIGFMAFYGAATALSEDFDHSLVPFIEILKIGLPILVGITTIDSIARLKQLAWVIAGCHIYLAYEFNLSYYSGFNFVQELGFGGADNNYVALGMTTAAGLTFFLGLHARQWWLKLGAFVGAALMVNTVFFSFSRGGMLALVVTGIVSFLLLVREPKYYIFFILAAAMALRLAGRESRDRFSTIFLPQEERDSSAQSRVDLWAACLKEMVRHPILGVGPGRWGRVAHNYGFNEGKLAHTTWLELGAEAGIPALACLLAFYLICMARLWGISGRSDLTDPFLVGLARAVIAAVSGFMVAAQFVTAWGSEAPYYITLVGAVALKLCHAPAAAPVRPYRAPLVARIPATAAGLAAR